MSVVDVPVEKKSSLSGNSTERDEATAGLKTRDGIILRPQPSDDPNDPLNWSWFRKHAAMFTISYLALVCYVTVTTLVSATAGVAKGLEVPKDQAVYLGSTPVALYGVAPWLWSPLSHFIGRRPVLLMCNIIAIIGVVVAATAKTYGACLVGRIILGAGGSAFWTLGPASIGDIFFRHEKGKKIGISTLAIVVAPFLGTLIGGAIGNNPKLGWRGTQWIPLIFIAFGFVLQIFWLPETIYVREKRDQPSAFGNEAKAENNSSLWARYGIRIPKRSAENHHSFLFIATRPFVLLKYPAVLLASFWFAIAYMMHVGITAEIPLIFASKFDFTVIDIGLTGLSGLIGALIGEAFAGPTLDFIAKRSLKNDREWHPEQRLQAIWPALVAVPGGLLIFGATIQFGHSWPPPLVGQALYIFGIEIATTVVQTYILESYPRQGAEVNLVFNLFRNIFSYTAPFFTPVFIASSGFTAPFGLFAALTVFFFPFTIGVLMWKGKEIRKKGGDPGWSRD
ncbi:major facilitator superfamily domain-containing protein [Xylariaceae sp. FL0255]|nr:major facilitator superfamily domain-containing protein [Xylariaceae sp. FL0255]